MNNPAKRLSRDENADKQRISTEQFIQDYTELGVTKMAHKYGISESGLYKRRRDLQDRFGMRLVSPNLPSGKPRSGGGHVQQLNQHPSVVNADIQDGHIIVGSDSHYWPGIVSTAHNAFLEICREFKPKVVIKNGDELDFPAISRHSPIGWESRPKVSDEVDNSRAMLSEIEKVSPKARHIWPLGNHDGRFESRIANLAPEYANIHGVHLKDHFPKWEPCWACLVNDHTVIKHRIKGGIHAARNNTLLAGRTTVTGHLHSLKVWPHSDYNGVRYGVDCGTMADPYGPQFSNYTELNPLDWRSGFILLTFVKGRLLWPEQIFVSAPGTVQFRGREWNV